MHLINSKIVGTEHDIYWEDISTIINDMPPKPVLVLAVIQNSGEQEQLIKMLEACKLTPDQYTIIFLAHQQNVAWHQLRHRLNPYIVFLIGVLPVQLGVSALFKLSEPNHFNDTIWLPAPPFSDIAQHEPVKRHLWSAGMKPIFIDKLYGEISFH
jgi:hypothetical protein